MPEDKFLLSESDRDILRSVINAERNRIRNPKQRPAVNLEDYSEKPDVYIAYTPENGIPALSQAGTTGTGTTEDDDVPGMAECDLYRMNERLAGPNVEPIGYSKRVYNFSTTAIPGWTWITVIKDKFGIWIAHPLDSAQESSNVVFYEYIVRCENGYLNQYRRPITVLLSDQSLSRELGDWEYNSTEGCCDCGEYPATGTGTDGVTVSCCANTVPENLCLHFYDGTSDFEQFNNTSLLMTYYPNVNTVLGTTFDDSSGWVSDPINLTLDNCGPIYQTQWRFVLKCSTFGDIWGMEVYSCSSANSCSYLFTLFSGFSEAVPPLLISVDCDPFFIEAQIPNNRLSAGLCIDGYLGLTVSDDPACSTTGPTTGTGTDVMPATCDQCFGGTPEYFDVTASGFPGTCASANGTFRLFQHPTLPCVYYYRTSSLYIYISLDPSGNILVYQIGSGTITYVNYNIDSFGGICCNITGATYDSVSTVGCGGTPPATVTITPACGEVSTGTGTGTSGGLVYDCCTVDGMPATMYASITVTGVCSVINGSYPISYSAPSTWSYNSGGIQITLTCTAGAAAMTITYNGTTWSNIGFAFSCTPPNYTQIVDMGTGSGGGGCDGDTMSVTISS